MNIPTKWCQENVFESKIPTDIGKIQQVEKIYQFGDFSFFIFPNPNTQRTSAQIYQNGKQLKFFDFTEETVDNLYYWPDLDLLLTIELRCRVIPIAYFYHQALDTSSPEVAAPIAEEMFSQIKFEQGSCHSIAFPSQQKLVIGLFQDIVVFGGEQMLIAQVTRKGIKLVHRMQSQYTFQTIQVGKCFGNIYLCLQQELRVLIGVIIEQKPQEIDELFMCEGDYSKNNLELVQLDSFETNQKILYSNTHALKTLCYLNLTYQDVFIIIKATIDSLFCCCISFQHARVLEIIKNNEIHDFGTFQLTNGVIKQAFSCDNYITILHMDDGWYLSTYLLPECQNIVFENPKSKLLQTTELFDHKQIIQQMYSQQLNRFMLCNVDYAKIDNHIAVKCEQVLRSTLMIEIFKAVLSPDEDVQIQVHGDGRTVLIMVKVGQQMQAEIRQFQDIKTTLNAILNFAITQDQCNYKDLAEQKLYHLNAAYMDAYLIKLCEKYKIDKFVDSLYENLINHYITLGKTENEQKWLLNSVGLTNIEEQAAFKNESCSIIGVSKTGLLSFLCYPPAKFGQLFVLTKSIYQKLQIEQSDLSAFESQLKVICDEKFQLKQQFLQKPGQSLSKLQHLITKNYVTYYASDFNATPLIQSIQAVCASVIFIIDVFIQYAQALINQTVSIDAALKLIDSFIVCRFETVVDQIFKQLTKHWVVDLSCLQSSQSISLVKHVISVLKMLLNKYSGTIRHSALHTILCLQEVIKTGEDNFVRDISFAEQLEKDQRTIQLLKDEYIQNILKTPINKLFGSVMDQLIVNTSASLVQALQQHIRSLDNNSLLIFVKYILLSYSKLTILLEKALAPIFAENPHMYAEAMIQILIVNASDNSDPNLKFRSKLLLNSHIQSQLIKLNKRKQYVLAICVDQKIQIEDVDIKEMLQTMENLQNGM